MSSSTVEILALFGAVASAFGIAASGHEFALGLAMGIGGALAAQLILRYGMVENAKPMPWPGTVLIGVLFAIVTGQLAQFVWPELPVSAAMFAGGFLSSFLGPAVLKAASTVSKNVPLILSRFLDNRLPKKRDGDGS
ncbi:MAG: hypothetical protein AAGP08_07770 [Pseudomonadota bacterium]